MAAEQLLLLGRHGPVMPHYPAPFPPTPLLSCLWFTGLMNGNSGLDVTENENVTCCVSQQRMSLPSERLSRHPPSPTHGVSPERTQDGNTRMPAIKPPSVAAAAPAAYPERPDDKAPDTGLGELKGISKGDFTEPGLLHLSRNRKVLNSLTGDVWFFFH